MLKQLEGITAKWITGDGGCTPELIKLGGDALSAKTYCTQPGLPLDQMADKTFKDRYKKRFGASVQIYVRLTPTMRRRRSSKR